MSNALIGTYGAWLISFVIGTTLYGVAMLQTWLYFQWYPNDSWVIKWLLCILAAIETSKIALCSKAIYWYLVENFGNFDSLLMFRWEELMSVVLISVVAFIVQCYFAHSIWILSGGCVRRRLVVVFICMLASLSLCGGLVDTVKVLKAGRISHFDRKQGALLIQSASALACDILITVTLCLALYTSRQGERTRSTDSLINKLIIYAVHRGLLTSIFAALNLFFTLFSQNSFWFLIGFLPGSELYMNSMLATLNSREFIRSSVEEYIDRATALSFARGPMVPSANQTPLDIAFPHNNSGVAISESQMSQFRDKEPTTII